MYCFFWSTKIIFITLNTTLKKNNMKMPFQPFFSPVIDCENIYIQKKFSVQLCG